MRPDGAADRDIVVADRRRAPVSCGDALGGREGAHRLDHLVQRPAQVDRRRPGGEEHVIGVFEGGIGGLGAQPQGHAVSRRWRRSAARRAPPCVAMARAASSRPGKPHGCEFVRQSGLVDDADRYAHRPRPRWCAQLRPSIFMGSLALALPIAIPAPPSKPAAASYHPAATRDSFPESVPRPPQFGRRRAAKGSEDHGRVWSGPTGQEGMDGRNRVGSAPSRGQSRPLAPAGAG